MWLAKLPIRRKLMMVIMLTSGSVVLLTLISFLAYEYFAFRKSTVRELSIMGSILATNSTAALAFDSPAEAGDILSALQAESQIVSACLYDTAGNVFATYPFGLDPGQLPVFNGEEGYTVSGGYLEGFTPVLQGNVRLGTLYLRSSMSVMRERFQLYFILAGVLATMSFVLAYFLSSKFQQRISGPILSLATTAAFVSGQKDYSARAKKVSDDEIGFLTDAFNNMLSEIQAQNQALRANQAKLENIVQGMGDAYFNLDADWKCTYVNDRALRLFATEKKDFLDKTIWEVFRMFKGSDIDEAYQKPMHERTAVAFEDYYPVVDMWLEARAFPEDGGTAIFFTDVTKYRKAEEEVRSFNEKLEGMVADRTRELQLANKELESFSYSVSHDLRAPLRSVHGYMNIFEEEYASKLDDEAKRLMKIIQDNAKKMGQLIDDLLSFSRLGRKELMKAHISMSDLVGMVWDDLQKGEDHRDIQMTISPLPVAYADSVTMRHVWQNLISNAVKYTRHKPKAIIEIGSETQKGRTAFFVRDNGSGFDMRYYEKLFGVFQRLHSQEEFEGTGVGLAIVHRIISRHGGEIWAEAKPDQGATFFFTLSES